MSKKGETVQLGLNFPKGEYPYLRQMCAERGISVGELVTVLLCGAVEKYEDRKLRQRARKRLKEMDHSDNVLFDKVVKEVGWRD